jgi:RNA polymerase sigma-70 factor (ECF subfamily)
MTATRMSIPLASYRAGAGETERLVQRLADADPSAIGEVYDRYGVAVRTFARRLVGDEAAAEDLVHDVFVSLPKAAKRFRGESSLKTFLYSIAVNHGRHHVRGAMRRRTAMERVGRDVAPASDATPEREVSRAELAGMLVRALDTLPLDQRVAFVLCEVEERTSAEAAVIAGAPEATMRTRLFHAKRKLRAALSREGLE